MDMLTNILAVIETAALLGALVFAGKAFKEKKEGSNRKSRYNTSLIFMAVYLVLNFLRNFYL